MTTAIVPYKVQPPAALLPSNEELSMIKAIAATATQGGSLLPMIGSGSNARKMNAGEAAVIMLYGRELGVQPMAALNQIYVVKNRPQPSAQLLVGLMQSRDPEAWVEVLERTVEKARVRIHYKGRAQVFEATMDDAERAKLIGNPTWATYPKQMLIWTAVRTGVRIMAPDAINALAQLPAIDQAGEMMEATETPHIIEGEAVELPAEPEPSSLTAEDEAEITSEPEPAPPPKAKPAPATRECAHEYAESNSGAIACVRCGELQPDPQAQQPLATTSKER